MGHGGRRQARTGSVIPCGVLETRVARRSSRSRSRTHTSQPARPVVVPRPPPRPIWPPSVPAPAAVAFTAPTVQTMRTFKQHNGLREPSQLIGHDQR